MNKKKKIVIGLLTIAIIAISIVIVPNVFNKASDAKIGEIIAETTILTKSSVSETLSTSGTIKSASSINLVTKLSGEVNSLLVEIADSVKTGQLLATLDTVEMNVSIADQMSKINSLKKQINTLTTEKNTTKKISFENAKFIYDNAENLYKNNVQLYENSAISKLELDQSLESKNKSYSDYESAKIAYESYNYEKELSLLEEELSIENMRLESLNKDLKAHEIISPIDGEITNVLIATGDSVSNENVLFEIQDLDELQVEASISEYEIQDVKVGQKVTVTTLGNKEKSYDGVIAKIYPSAEISGTDVSVTILIDLIDEDRDLKPNFSANIEILTNSKDDAFLVSYDALVKTPNGYLVKVAGKDGELPTSIKVTTGIKSDMMVEIISDQLKEGMEILVDAADTETATATTDKANSGVRIPGLGGGGASAGGPPADGGGGRKGGE